MENWTLDDWLNDLDNCVKRGLYFEISGHSAGLLRDQIKKAADEIEQLRDALQFYASKNNYETKKVWTTTLMIKNIAFPQYEPDGYKIVSQYHTPVLSDNGEKARAALKEKA